MPRLSAILGFCRDCPRSLASCRDYGPWKNTPAKALRHLLLPVETTVRKNWLPADSASCRDTWQEGIYHVQRLDRKQEIVDSLGGSQIWRTVSAGSENWRTIFVSWLLSCITLCLFVHEDAEPVYEDCTCNPELNETTAEPYVSLPEWCHSPDGTNCNWYSICLEVVLYVIQEIQKNLYYMYKFIKQQHKLLSFGLLIFSSSEP